MTKQQRVLSILGVAAVVAIGFGAWASLTSRERAGGLTLYGNVDIREVELAFRVGGRLATMRYDEGDSVKRGDVVADLDAEPYREALAVAEARVEQAQANLAKFKAGTRPQEVERAKQAVTEAQAAYDNAIRDFKRQSGLVESGASSEKTLDTARTREPGSMLAPGTSVYSLSLRDPLYVRAYVDEPSLGKLAPGTHVSVRTDSSTKTYTGQIGFISPRAEFTPKSVETTNLRTDLVYRLRIVVSDADEGLRQGMPVTVHVPLTGNGK